MNTFLAWLIGTLIFAIIAYLTINFITWGGAWYPGNYDEDTRLGIVIIGGFCSFMWLMFCLDAGL